MDCVDVDDDAVNGCEHEQWAFNINNISIFIFSCGSGTAPLPLPSTVTQHTPPKAKQNLWSRLWLTKWTSARARDGEIEFEYLIKSSITWLYENGWLMAYGFARQCYTDDLAFLALLLHSPVGIIIINICRSGSREPGVAKHAIACAVRVSIKWI